MKIVVINQKIALVRHWFKWYVVARGAKDWQPMKIEKYQKEKTISEIASDLKKAEKKKRP